MVNGATMSAEEFGRVAGVSRETLTRLQAYEGLLQQWQQKINLVSRTTLSDVWRRHFLDSAQLSQWVDPDTSTLDMGSGAGFPGMVLSIMRGAPILLAESDSRKCAFLREVRRVSGARAEIFDGRVEALEPATGYGLIIARALAPVSRLLELARPLLARDGYCIFMKGEQVDQELEEAAGAWTMDLTKHPSVADPRGVILEIRNPDRVL